MKPYLSDTDVTLYQGDALEVLRELPDESVHMCATSPPFFGLRDYGVPGQIGLESTPEEWVARLVDVFREVRRVLRSDGTLWLEIGESYAGSWGAQGHRETPASISRNQIKNHPKRASHTGTIRQVGLKPKDLIGAPWLLAFALRADGWYLRSEIIWSKPNPMPESVTDRPTMAHSRAFLLAKSGQPTYWTHGILAVPGHRTKPKPDYWWHPPAGVDGVPSHEPVEGWTRRNAWRGHDYFYDAEAIREPSDPAQEEHNRRYARPYDNAERINGGQPGNVNHAGIHSRPGPGGRNRRSVWEIATEPYAAAHFATWPQKLVEPMILAGTSERGCCPECGAPWERVVERELGKIARVRNVGGRTDGFTQPRRPPGATDADMTTKVRTTGWQPTCSCDVYEGWRLSHEIQTFPATVLDPFAGSGTTLYVARRLGRRSIGIELSGEYVKLATERLAQQSLLAEGIA